MKRLLFILIICFSCISSTFADNYTPDQLKFRSSLMAFLKEEGFSPYIDNTDNSLCFKKEGVVYWIMVGKDTPHFMTFNRSGWSFSGENAIDRDKAIVAANDVNRVVESAKVYCSDKNVVFSVESYSRSSEDYKYVFYANMRSLDSAYSNFKKQYNGNTSSDSSQGGSSDSSPSSYSNVQPSSGGNTIYFDQFNSDNASWKASNEGNIKYSNGKLIITDRKNFGWTMFQHYLPVNLTNRDFEIEFYANYTFKDNYSTINFFFGTSFDTSHHIGMTDWGDGNIRVNGGTYSDDRIYSNKEYAKCEGFVDDGYNKIVIRKVGNKVYAYCNGTLEFSSQLADGIEINSIGFYMSHKHQVQIDYIKVSTL
jgi:hypothetical protein